MNARRTLTVAISGAAVVALLVPALGAAALPKPTTARVVPFKSIGAIQFGTSKATAVQKWGQPMCAHEDTTGQDTCVWLSASSSDFPEEGTAVQLDGGKVCGMLMRAGTNFRTGSLTITRLKKWRTEEGVGLGSKMRDAKKILGGTTVKKKHHVTTAFFPGTTDSSQNKVEAIEIYKDGCNVT
jgi:hypothetical protein